MIVRMEDNGQLIPVAVIVRCKDCKNRNTYHCFKDEQGFGTDDDWFCADGKEKVHEE